MIFKRGERKIKLRMELVSHNCCETLSYLQFSCSGEKISHHISVEITFFAAYQHIVKGTVGVRKTNYKIMLFSVNYIYCNICRSAKRVEIKKTQFLIRRLQHLTSLVSALPEQLLASSEKVATRGGGACIMSAPVTDKQHGFHSKR